LRRTAPAAQRPAPGGPSRGPGLGCGHGAHDAPGHTVAPAAAWHAHRGLGGSAHDPAGADVPWTVAADASAVANDVPRAGAWAGPRAGTWAAAWAGSWHPVADAWNARPDTYRAWAAARCVRAAARHAGAGARLAVAGAWDAGAVASTWATSRHATPNAGGARADPWHARPGTCATTSCALCISASSSCAGAGAWDSRATHGCTWAGADSWNDRATASCSTRTSTPSTRSGMGYTDGQHAVRVCST